ncbi:uncharacterized protein LOC133234032 [Bos javanicus]|uniref:uncharacterized protein LOC133234032 n=1 Tax=Bos javanicus TaxID=9906 RepID=UPI002AA8387E|nr:uncharacterized protein LOC133234032 [Bos javanicus]
MEAEASPPVGSPPCCLWFQRPGVYEDEKGRIWVAVAMQIIPSYRARGSGAPESTVSPGAGGEPVKGRWCRHDHPTSAPGSAPAPAGPEDPGPWLCVQLSIPNGARLSLQHDDSITVHLWQLPNQMPRSPSSLLVSGLPIKWELYPGRRYRGTDSRLWEIVDHDQASRPWHWGASSLVDGSGLWGPCSDPQSLIPETGSSLAEGLELGLLSYPWSCSNGAPAQFLRASLTVNFCLPPDPAGPVP